MATSCGRYSPKRWRETKVQGPLPMSESRHSMRDNVMTGCRVGLVALVVIGLGWFSMAEDRSSAPSTRAKPDTVRVAGVVLKWIRQDKDANWRRVEPLIREAAAGGAQIVCTTECFLDGYAIADKSIPLDQYRALGERIPQGEYFRKLSALTRELNI